MQKAIVLDICKLFFSLWIDFKISKISFFSKIIISGQVFTCLLLVTLFRQSMIKLCFEPKNKNSMSGLGKMAFLFICCSCLMFGLLHFLLFVDLLFGKIYVYLSFVQIHAGQFTTSCTMYIFHEFCEDSVWAQISSHLIKFNELYEITNLNEVEIIVQICIQFIMWRKFTNSTGI